MPSLPTNFNDTDALVDFGKELGISVGVGFLVPAVVFSLILIFIFVKFCGGSGKTRQEFTAQTRVVLIVVAGAIFAICLATCIVGWTYNDKIHNGIEDGKGTLQGVIITSYDLFDSVDATVGSLQTRLVDEIHNQTDPIIQNLTNLLVPLGGILDTVEDAENTLQNLTVLTQQVVNNITIVEQEIDNLSAFQNMSIISDVPSKDDVPDVDSQYVSSLNSSVNNLQEVVDNVKNMTSDVNDTLTDISTTVTLDLISLISDYDNQANDVISYIMDFQDQVASTNDSFNDYDDDVTHYSSVRRSIVAAILVLPLTLTGLALVGVIFRIKLILKISAAFCFIFMFWYFLVSGINYLAFYTLDQVCINQEDIIVNALSINSEDINIPGANVSVKVSTAVLDLLKCSDNNTLINIFDFHFLVDDLTGEIEQEVRSLNNQTSQLNQTDNYLSGLDSLAKMENSSVNLDFLQNRSLPTVHAQLVNVSSNLNASINDPSYWATLQAVNDITNNLVLINGTTINMYYDETNITSLNCTEDPYDQMSASAQQDLCAKAATAITRTQIRNLQLLHANEIYSNITDIDQRLYGFETALVTINEYQNTTHDYATEIRGYLGDAYNRANGIIGQVDTATDAIMALIYDTTGRLVAETQCAFVGDAYASLSRNLCADVRDSLEVITAMMIIGALMMFASAVASMVTSYKLERDFLKRIPNVA